MNSTCTLQWMGDAQGYLRLLDQTLLPSQLVYLDCMDVATVWEAIKSLRVRGAPAIGIAAAYGVLLAVSSDQRTEESLGQRIQCYLAAIDYLSTSRPTAVNLFWALDRMRQAVQQPATSALQLSQRLWREALAIHDQDRQMCRAIGIVGAELIPPDATVMTHCNAGGLATSELGTALSVIYTSVQQGKRVQVFVDETRPLWQGARLTAWELMQANIPTTVICDNMAAHIMQTRKVDAVFVGADRITARGDTANKIGTYALAVVANYHGVPFYVAAPSSTFDLSLLNGEQIPIEQRDADEVIRPYGIELAPRDAQVYNPAFDVTPAELITAIITERGLIQPVCETQIRQVLDREFS